MSDREAMKLALSVLKGYANYPHSTKRVSMLEHARGVTVEAIIALEKSLAAPEPEPEKERAETDIPARWCCFGRNQPPPRGEVYHAPPAAAPAAEKERAEVAAPARGVGQTEEIDSFTPEVYHEKRHPGYVIGNHWLETAYERLCAGETEDAILEDYELAREPRLRNLRRDAERYWWLLNWLVKTGLLSRERCRIDSPASFGDWWILRKPKVIDGSDFIGYGETEDAAIAAAMEPAMEPAIRARGEVPR